MIWAALLTGLTGNATARSLPVSDARAIPAALTGSLINTDWIVPSTLGDDALLSSGVGGTLMERNALTAVWSGCVVCK